MKIIFLAPIFKRCFQEDFQWNQKRVDDHYSIRVDWITTRLLRPSIWRLCFFLASWHLGKRSAPTQIIKIENVVDGNNSMRNRSTVDVGNHCNQVDEKAITIDSTENEISIGLWWLWPLKYFGPVNRSPIKWFRLKIGAAADVYSSDLFTLLCRRDIFLSLHALGDEDMKARGYISFDVLTFFFS